MTRDSRGRLLCHLLLAAGMASVAAPTLAQTGSRLTATVDRNEITLEDQILLQVTFAGGQRVQPDLPELPAFRVLSRGESQQVAWVNGRTSTSLTFNYVLIPLKAGRFEIGPVTAELDGKVYSSQPFAVVVHEAAAAPARSKDYYLTARVSNPEPYVGQQVMYTWRFYRRLHVDVRDATLTALEFGDFLVEELGEVQQFRTTVDGVEFMVSEIRKAIFPQQVGEVQIPPSELVCQVALPSRSRRRSIFDLGRVPTEQKVLRSRPITLQVRPLPAPPARFSGLVGDYDIAAAISKTDLKVGESATLSVTLSGEGNVQMLSAPAIPELEGFKVYDDRPSGTMDRSGRSLRGRKTFRKALVPLVPGPSQIPPIQVVYFDPENGSYRTRATATIAMDIAPSADKEDLMLTESVAPTTGKVAVRILADDILPIERDLDALAPRRVAGLRGWGWTGGALAPPLGYLGLLFYRRRQDRFRRDKSLRRHQLALKTSLRGLRELASDETAKRDRGVLARQASACLRHYVGDRLGVDGGVLTSREVEEMLARAGIEPATVRRCREVLERLEGAQYGALSGAGLEHPQLVKTLEQLVQELDRQTRTRKWLGRGR